MTTTNLNLLGIVEKLSEDIDESNIQNVPAVYMAFNHETKDFYVGSTNRQKRRLNEHKNQLRNNEHPNHKFQKSFNNNQNFVWSSVQCETREDAANIEKTIIDTCIGDKHFLNLSQDVSLPMYGRKHSEETKQKIRESIKNSDKRKIGIEKQKQSLEKYYANLSEERKQELSQRNSESHKGLIKSEEHCESLRKAANAQWERAAPEERERARQQLLGNTYCAKQVMVNGVIYSSIGDVAKEYGIANNTVTYRLQSQLPQWNSWQYL